MSDASEVNEGPTVGQLTETWLGLRDRAEALVSERPDDPGRVANIMHEVEMLMLEIADYLNNLNHQRYTAGRAHSKRRNAALSVHGKSYGVTIARALADVDALPEQAAWDALRAAYHYAEDTQKALQTKHYGLMNVNKNMQSVMFERGRRQ